MRRLLLILHVTGNKISSALLRGVCWLKKSTGILGTSDFFLFLVAFSLFVSPPHRGCERNDKDVRDSLRSKCARTHVVCTQRTPSYKLHCSGPFARFANPRDASENCAGISKTDMTHPDVSNSSTCFSREKQFFAFSGFRESLYFSSKTSLIERY